MWQGLAADLACKLMGIGGPHASRPRRLRWFQFVEIARCSSGEQPAPSCQPRVRVAEESCDRPVGQLAGDSALRAPVLRLCCLAPHTKPVVQGRDETARF